MLNWRISNFKTISQCCETNVIFSNFVAILEEDDDDELGLGGTEQCIGPNYTISCEVYSEWCIIFNNFMVNNFI